jgi:dihydropteroate synthase
MQLKCRYFDLNLDRVAVMGILNVTPDSFSDGGLWLDPEAAIKHGLEMVEQGASIIDIGGESTRPGAEEVPLEEELRRVLPVIEGLSAASQVAISIDTRKPEVARRAVDAGAGLINDTAGEISDREMDRVAVETGAAICVMHSRGTPATMREMTDYDDVVSFVGAFLSDRGRELQALGVAPDAIVLDPGIGFAKDPKQNLELLRRMGEISALGWPILVGTSRKSFIGAVLDVPEDQRVEGSIATALAAISGGARIIRAHDVVETVRAVRMHEAVSGS